MVLAIETSDMLCSVAFWEVDRVLAEFNFEQPMQHASLLAEWVHKGEQFLASLPDPKTLQDLTLITVSLGPGSFTGLRIGLSFAQGLALAGQVPIKGVSNHLILAQQAPLTENVLYSAIFARKKELYLARLERLAEQWRVVEQNLVEHQRVVELLPEGQKLILHKRVQLAPTLVEELAKKDVKIISRGEYFAHYQASVGYQLWRKEGADILDELEPIYVQPFAGVM